LNQPAQADLSRILAALKGLHRAFPIEQRLKTQACDSTRETYLAVLSRWMQTSAAPSPAGFDTEALDELLALDTLYLTEDEQAIGAAPFCPVPTDIALHFPHENLHALSALDALALPRILDTAGIIETHCPVSGQPISLRIDAQGNPFESDLDKAIVVFRKLNDDPQHYASDVAPGIRFVHPALASQFPQQLSLSEAAAVAHGFYAFQRRLFKS
jgi:Alkylmercury lyase